MRFTWREHVLTERERESSLLILLEGRKQCLFNSLQLHAPYPTARHSPAVQNNKGSEQELSLQHWESGSGRGNLFLGRGDAGAPTTI